MAKKLILINLLLILAVIAGTATVTFAYFSSTRTESLTLNTARVGINETSNFPLRFENLLPGEWKSQAVAVRNTGSVAADFYLQMEPEWNAETNFCTGPQGEVFTTRVEAVDASGNGLGEVFSGSLCDLYPLDGSAVIARLASEVSVGEWRYFRVSLKLNEDVNNDYYMNAANTDRARLIAVQHGAPAPQPAAGKLWPEGDPNY